MKFNFLKPDAYLNDLLGAEKAEGRKDIPIDLLVEIEDQPFRPYTEGLLDALAADIAQNGLLSPLVVRKLPQDGTYEIIAGRNRCNACKRLKMTEVPCIVKNDLTDAQRDLILVNSNLIQRQSLLPSERAKAYKLQFDACRALGIKQSFPDSQATAYKYLRLNDLLPELLAMVDEGRIKFAMGYEVSGFGEPEQRWLLEYLSADPKAKITKALLRNLQDNGAPSGANEIDKIIDEKPENGKAVIQMNRFRGELRNVSADDFAEFLLICEYGIAKLYDVHRGTKR